MPKRRKSKQPNNIEIYASVILIVLFVFLFIQFFHHPVYYDLKDMKEDGSIETIQSYSSFSKGKEAFNEAISLEQYENPVLMKDGEIFLIKYGIVNFKTKDCTVNTDYIKDDGEKGYLNGCYGTNGLFIDGNEDKIKFKLSGVTGWVHRKDVELLNYRNENEVKSLDYYLIYNNEIYHKISGNPKEDLYSNSLYLGKVLPEMKQNYYFSYDGHYFYDNFYSMADDERNNLHDHAINSTAYYFSYQYKSHRELSNYSTYELNAYIQHITDSTSKLYLTGSIFKKYEAIYHTNAAMMLSLAMNESSYGKSAIALEKNNLFGHKVYDSDTSQGNSYSDIDECIRYHADKFLDSDYLNQESNHYKGEYFGNKESGLNVYYASDPYWGEKSAGIYARLDEYLGLKDK